MKQSRAFRSVLYVPGNNERAIEKARSLPVDAIIFDLEDAVALSDKNKARKRVAKALAEMDFGERFVAARLNDPQSETGKEDLRAMLAAGPDVLVIPKVQSPQDIVSLSDMIDRSDDRSRIKNLEIWSMMETPNAILNVKEIAELAKSVVPRLGGFVMGTNDLARETRSDVEHMVCWSMSCVLAARANGLGILDGVYNDFSDEAGLRHECKRGRAMGMDGKTLIHPAQIDVCNEIFSPSAGELDEAKEIVRQFEQPGNADKNVLEIRGRMVERLHYEMAVEFLQRTKLNPS